MSPAVIQVAKAVVVAFFGALASVFVSSLDEDEPSKKNSTKK
ncbi:MAG: hypothetical protein Q8O24_07040 [Gallionellaceae bacterium]|nr:hypothetical protein [Gallionellaceae bacterium]